MSVISVDALSVELGGAWVLSDVVAAVEDSEWVTLIGPNGSGKTTLLRAIAGLVHSEGAIAMDGTPVQDLSRRELAHRLALVPQTPAIPTEMTVGEYVLLGRTPHLAYFGSEGAADREAADRALARLDLIELAGRRLGTLSGGERQRAVLARALAQEASLLLLDEPTSALDIGRQQQALELVDSLRRDGGLTVLSAMHDLTLAGLYADRLVLLDRGRVVATGPPHEVLTRDLIAEVYGASVTVIENGSVFVVPSRHGPSASS